MGFVVGFAGGFAVLVGVGVGLPATGGGLTCVEVEMGVRGGTDAERSAIDASARADADRELPGLEGANNPPLASGEDETAADDGEPDAAL